MRKLLTYNKSDFTGYRHFVGGISKFMPHLFFLEQPIAVDSITIQALDRIFKEQYLTRT